MLSQREIDQSVDPANQAALRRLLDDFIAQELAALEQIARERKGQVQAQDLAIESMAQGQSLKGSLVTQKLDLESRLHRLDSVRVPLAQWTSVETENAYVSTLLSAAESIERAVQDVMTRFTEMADISDEWQHRGLLQTLKDSVTSAIGGLRTSIGVALDDFRRSAVSSQSPVRQLIASDWEPIHAAERVLYQKVKKELEEKGDRPEDYLRVAAQLAAVQSQIDQVERERVELDRLENDRNLKLEALRTVWLDQTTSRERKAQELMDRLKPHPGATPLVQIQVVHQGDASDVLRLWSTKLGDRRRLTEADIQQIITSLAANPGTQGIPKTLVDAIRAAENKSVIQALLGNRAKAFYEVFSEPALRGLELERGDDAITYRIYREDGSLAGPIENVSAGQKGLAFLNLLLASGDMPLLVDTPEEGLDNEGVYSELVPIFRREKEKRQIFVITHNANIPVNADAELIACLEPCGTIERTKLEEILTASGGSSDSVDLDHLARSLSE